MSTRIGIVGSGIVGQTLANGFVKHGYDVTIGTNTASKREELRSKTNGQVKVGSFETRRSSVRSSSWRPRGQRPKPR